MKVIDVLNKMANGEEIPKSIQYDGEQYVYDEKCKDYTYVSEYNNDVWLFCKYDVTKILNDEIQIIDESKEDFENIELLDETRNMPCISAEKYDFILKYNSLFEDYENKINKLIANQKKIIEKIETKG